MRYDSLDLLFPAFRAKVERGLTKARASGLQAYPFETYRSIERQSELFAQGRMAPGKIVTYVRAGKSLHHYGLAVDIVFDGSEKPGVQWSWEGDYIDGKKDDYARLAVIMKDQGLEWLGDKNIEAAHFQLTYGMTISEIEAYVKAKGILDFWGYLSTKIK